MANSQLPIEVELALELMPCFALRSTYDEGHRPHACAYFGEWGHYHSYGYDTEGAPEQPTIVQPATYAGKRRVVPEMLSGCRKAPILCVGINPNLPGWTSTTRNAIHPYFDDVLQYAHYFRYRTRDKLRIPESRYETLLGSAEDGPDVVRPLQEAGSAIDVEASPVLMYRQYQRLLDGLAERRGWNGHELAVGEDIAYANMVACPSTRWVDTRPNQDDPDMPVMGAERVKGIVHECFYKRRHFLRQLFQSLPAVILVFSRTTAREFIQALQGRFSMGDPKPNEPLQDLFEREIRLRYGRLRDGTELDARVLFMAHASARPDEFEAMVAACVDRLDQEVERGQLEFNAGSGHLRRGRGACVFCENALYRIGRCDYRDELRPLASGAVQALAEDAHGAALADKSEQLDLLEAFVAPTPAPTTRAATARPLDETDDAAPLILRGRVASMAGPPQADAAVYISGDRIVDVRAADAPAPDGFASARLIETGGTIYPGLMDLHNHLAYNVLPLWQPPRRFDNRSQWLSRRDYRRDVTEPMQTIVRSGQGAIKAVIRYIEVKLLLGGATSGQGMRSKFGGSRFYGGLCRNFESPEHPDLPAAETHVPDMRADTVDQIRANLDSGAPCFLHLAEGLDTRARQQFMMLDENAMLRPNLIGIHSLGLHPAQHAALRDSGASVVWSPLSNSLLYGSTIDPTVLRAQGAVFGLGSDWTPSGSRNLLMELKVAWLCSRAAGDVFDAEALVRAVTVDAARIAGWDAQLGTIEPGKLADLIVLDDRVGDVYENLIRATERELRLVLVGGVPRHGDTALMRAAGLRRSRLEAIEIGGRDKSLHLHHPGSPLDGLSLSVARERLEAAMSDLDAIRNASEPLFEPMNDEPLLDLELDMQADIPPGEIELMADLPPLASIPLDGLTAIDDPDWFDRLEAVPHLPAFYKGDDGLRGFYR